MIPMANVFIIRILLVKKIEDKMKASEMIKKLEEIKQTHGDLEVFDTDDRAISDVFYLKRLVTETENRVYPEGFYLN